MELILFLLGCVWLVTSDMRAFTGNKQWPRGERKRVKRPGEP